MNKYKEDHISWIDIICINLYTLMSFQYFSYNVIPEIFARVSSQLAIAIMLIYTLPTIIKHQVNPYIKIMKYIVLWTIISIFLALVFWGQGLFAGFRGTSVALSLCFFFYLIKRNIPLGFLRKYVLCWSFIYIILWLYALSNAPEVIFSYAEETDDGFDVLSDARGIFRVNLVGLQLLILGWFICFDNSLKKKYRYIIPAVIIYLVIVMQLTRQIILWTAVVSIIYFFYYHRKMFLGFLVAIIIGIGTLPSIEIDDNGILGGLWTVTQMELEENKGSGENIRITEYKVLFSEWAPNPIAYVLGSGYPHISSPYGKYEKRWKQQKKVYLGDVGYGKMMATLGIVGLVLFIILFYKCSIAKIDIASRYSKMYMIYLIPAHIGAAWYCSFDGQIAIAISVYTIMMGSRSCVRNKVVASTKIIANNEIQCNNTSLQG